jgi:hypothetical protein
VVNPHQIVTLALSVGVIWTIAAWAVGYLTGAKHAEEERARKWLTVPKRLHSPRPRYTATASRLRLVVDNTRKRALTRGI